jgi:hypothetical protein
MARPAFKKGGKVTGKAADKATAGMVKKAKSGKGTLSFTPKKGK